MKKSILLKMLMGLITTGIAMSAGIHFHQNTTDAVIAKADIQEEKTIADTLSVMEGKRSLAEEADATEGKMAALESMIHDEQSADTVIVAEEQSADVVVVADEQRSIDVQKMTNTANTTESEVTVITQPEVKTEASSAVTQPENTVVTPPEVQAEASSAVTQPENAAVTQPEVQAEASSAVTQPENAAVTQPEVQAETSSAVTQPENTVVTQPDAKTEAATMAAAPEAVVQPEETIEENQVVTSNIATAVVVIHFPPSKTEETEEPGVTETQPEVTEVEPEYIEIYNCSCGCNLYDYDSLKEHMKDHLFKGEAHSYTLCVIKKNP